MKRKIIRLLISFCLVFSCLFLNMFPQTINSVCAETQQYSNVLEDLQKDENFNAYSFAIDNEDYSLQVITIAESEDKELFVYVYQPCWQNTNLRATSINISTSASAISYQNYDLQYLNSNSCFYKYKVKNFIVSTATTRTYEISSVYRAWNENYDVDVDSENTINEVNFAVGKKWTFQTNLDLTTSCVCQDIDLIEITDKYVGFVRYGNGSAGLSILGIGTMVGLSGSNISSEQIDCHYVAFSTDRQIDKLMSADVYYVSQSYVWSNSSFASIPLQNEEIYGTPIDNYVTLNYDSRVSGQAFYGRDVYTYSWNRIQSVDEFIATETSQNVYHSGIFYQNTETGITEEGLEDLEDKDWVLRFGETSYEKTYYANFLSVVQGVEKTIVSDVSILRLEFETDGIIYNLGVLDNKQSGDSVPDNFYTISSGVELPDWLKTLLALLALLIILIILAPILPFIIKFIVWLIKSIITIIVLPFKLIAESKNKKKNKGKKK